MNETSIMQVPSSVENLVCQIRGGCARRRFSRVVAELLALCVLHDEVRSFSFDIEVEGVLEIWNKTDLLDDDTLSAMQSVKTSETGPILLSAITGSGTDKLLEKIEERIAGSDDVVDVLLPIEELGKLPSLYKSTHVIERMDLEDGSVQLTIRANREIRKTLGRLLIK